MERPPRIPKTQRAVQLVGPDELRLNGSKPVPRPGPQQILCRVEAVGLCFSDLKLVKQFAAHPRKSEIVSGIDPAVLADVPSYVPGERPTVPGHEAAVRVCAVGDEVRGIRPGERYLVQTDYRWLRTAHSNASFGYNFEGALQEYVLLDQRVITSPSGEVMLLRASEHLAASAIALVEPWACVEDAYAEEQRRTILAGGRMLVVAEADGAPAAVECLVPGCARPAELVWVGRAPAASALDAVEMRDVSEVEDGTCDDLVYFGADAGAVERLFPKLAPRGILNIVLSGARLGRPVMVPVGRVHYGGIRIVGTTGSDPRAAMEAIPATAEIRPGARIDVVGAAGPMGVMHVIRSLCQGVPGVAVFAGDTDTSRLAALEQLAAPLAEARGLGFRAYNPARGERAEPCQYIVLMVPSPALVADAVARCEPGGIINVFAGIPADVSAEIDLDAYLEKQLYFVGTSGSTLADMRSVLSKVEGGQLDTNVSVAAVSGLDGAIDGIRAIERREIAGKVIVYPACRGLGLVGIDKLGDLAPDAARGPGEVWDRSAEDCLLRAFCAKG